jgi:dimethylargininase
MIRFSKALVRKPGMNFYAGLTRSDLGAPEPSLTLRQHHEYCAALMKCGLDLFILDPSLEFPDSPFVEDTCVLTDSTAIITRPGHISRRGEVEEVEIFIKNHKRLKKITEPGTLDGGDVMRIEDTYYIGQSKRSNNEGVGQLASILQEEGYHTEIIVLQKYLHLKEAINYLGDGRVIAHEHFPQLSLFSSFTIIPVPEAEAYASNSLRINDYVLVPEGFPVTGERLEKLGIPLLFLSMSEFRKMDGGLSCLSLRF